MTAPILHLLAWRDLREMTQRELAVAADIGEDAISLYECHHRWPGPENLGKLAEALGCQPADLFAPPAKM